jgi:hypothetical protein
MIFFCRNAFADFFTLADFSPIQIPDDGIVEPRDLVASPHPRFCEEVNSYFHAVFAHLFHVLSYQRFRKGCTVCVSTLQISIFRVWIFKNNIC